MADIKTKGSMEKPKVKTSGVVPKEAESIIKEKYQEQQERNAPGQKDPVRYATDKVESGGKRAARTAGDTIKQRAKKEFVKQRQQKRAQSRDTRPDQSQPQAQLFTEPASPVSNEAGKAAEQNIPGTVQPASPPDPSMDTHMVDAHSQGDPATPSQYYGRNLGRGILHELECANEGVLTIPTVPESCQIALYTVTLVSESSRTEHAVLCGLTDSGKALDDAACRSIFDLPAESSTEDERRSPHWLKGSSRPHPLDDLVPTKSLLEAQLERLSPAQAEEMERMKQQVSAGKATLSRELNTLDSKVQQAQAELEAVTGDRLKRLAAQKKINQLRQEYMKRQENQFFDAMRLDMELEEKIKAFADREKLTAKVKREFLVTVEVL